MISVHHLNQSRSQRVLWLLEELALPYQVIKYQRDTRTLLAPPQLRAIHALGKSPVLVDDELVLAESGAILDYLVERYDRTHRLSPAPQETTTRLRYRYWMHYAEGSAMPPLLMSLVFGHIRAAKMPFFARPIARAIVDKAMTRFVGPQLQLHLEWMERELGVHGWFAADRFTAADVQMSFPIQAAAARSGLQAYPNLADFVQRIEQRPAYQRALQQGGPFKLLGQD